MHFSAIGAGTRLINGSVLGFSKQSRFNPIHCSTLTLKTHKSICRNEAKCLEIAHSPTTKKNSLFESIRFPLMSPKFVEDKVKTSEHFSSIISRTKSYQIFVGQQKRCNSSFHDRTSSANITATDNTAHSTDFAS